MESSGNGATSPSNQQRVYYGKNDDAGRQKRCKNIKICSSAPLSG
jgi:hypothetical protein